MSVYVLATPERAAAAESALLPLLERHGFVVRDRREVGGRRLILVDNPNHAVITEAAGDDGDWIVAVGPFVYRGSSGAPALCEYLAAFRPDDGLWAETQGHFTLLVYKHRRLYVVCDGLGAHKVYHDPTFEVLSNAFLAILSLLRARSLDDAGAYVYAWTGACQAGRTFVRGLSFLAANVVAEVGEGVDVKQLSSPVLSRLSAPSRDFEGLVAANLDTLQQVVDNAARFAEGRVRLSFSGGFDSRLLLGTLRRAGVRPELYTYGQAGDLDVRVAQAVAEAEGLTLRRVDKDTVPVPEPERFPEVIERALVLFDGWTNTGLMDTGADAEDRPTRHAGGFVPMNGGLGEIYRNFFNLRGRRVTLDEVASAFYCRFDPRWATGAFDPRAYRELIVAQLAAQLGVAETERVDMQHAQLLYPLFRGRFWTAREAEINQRFGAMLFPYLEHACIAGAARVPLEFRYLGRLQAAMIRQADPALARLPNAYGFAFGEPPGLRYRLDALRSLYRPMWLRRRAARLRDGSAELPAVLRESHLAHIMAPGRPYTGRLFTDAAARDRDTWNRIVTMEYLCQRFAFDS